MADLITTKATFPKSGGLAVSDGAVSVNAGNGLHVNPSTGMVEVPVNTTAGLGYGSNGLEVEVDGSTVGFNSTGQLTALGGGGEAGVSLVRAVLTSNAEVLIGKWVLSTTTPGFQVYGLLQNKWLYLLSLQLLSSLTYICFNVGYSGSGTTYLNGVNVKDMRERTVAGAMGTISSGSEPFVREFYANYSNSGNKTEIIIDRFSSYYYPRGISMPVNVIFTNVQE